MSGAVPPPAARPLERAARVPRPVCPGCGRCGREDPAPAPQRAPLRAGVARCGGGRRASPGGVPFAVVRGAWDQALPLPRLPALLAGCRGPLPTCYGRGCAGVGALHRPRGPRALWGAARHGGGGGRLGSGTPSSLLTALWAGCRGPLAVCRGCGCGGCPVCVVPLGVALRLSLWCPPLWCFVAVLCSPCACGAPFPARVPCSSAGYLPFLPGLRRSLPFPLPSVSSPSSLACTFSLFPPSCVSRSFPLPASLAPVLGPSSFSPVGSCATEGGLGRVGLLGN